MEPIIKIKFNDELFFPGQTVKGIVEVCTPKVLLVKVIKFRALGCAKVVWHSSENVNDEKTRHSESEEYYVIRFNLLGSGSVSSYLNAGTHQYKFEFSLPDGVPASFESQFGYVRHTCAVFLLAERENFVECKRVAPFSVGSSLDLNENPFAHEPFILSEEKSLCCFCCSQGNISFSVNVDHSGYVPGENIVINAECMNESVKRTHSTSVEVVQKIKYKAQSSIKNSETVICSKSHPGIGPGGTDVWFGEMMKVPPVPPTGLPGCSLIDIGYEFKFHFIPSGLSVRLSSSFELIIGAVPVRQSFRAFSSQGQHQHPPPAASFPQVPPPPPFPQVPPPPPFPQGPSPPYPVSNPGVNAPYPPMGVPSAPSAPVLGFGGVPQQTSFYPGPQPAPVNTFNYPLESPPYPWAYLYPDLAPPIYKKGSLDHNINLLDFDEDDFANARNHGSEPVFVPRYVTYISNP